MFGVPAEPAGPHTIERGLGFLQISCRLENGPVAIGAVGGSGTRKVAEFLKVLGFYIGTNLNEPNDNLWFTLLFKRREILLTRSQEFSFLCDIFVGAMNGDLATLHGNTASDTVNRLAARDRPMHSAPWLKLRASSLLAAPSTGERWGWKEPNTHVVIDRLLELMPNLRYIHVTRNGLDMAYNRNQNQLSFWGPIFLGRNVVQGPRDSLAYWCAAHRRMEEIAEAYPKRILFVDFDQFCQDPSAICRSVANFCGMRSSDCAIDDFISTIIIPGTSGIHQHHDRADFNPSDLEYAATLGYRW